jgi:hypothetical protein
LWPLKAFNHLAGQLLYLVSIGHTHRLGGSENRLGNLGMVNGLPS